MFVPAILIAICFFCSWELTNIYNIAIGGKELSLYYYLFPLLENTYMYNILHINIPLYTNYWIPILLIFYLFIGQGITSLFSKKILIKQNTVLGLYISVLGLGQMMYFMNRCAYFNILPCYFQVILLILIISEYCMLAFKKSNKTIIDTILSALFYCSIAILIAINTDMFINIKPKMSSMKQYRDMNQLNQISAYLKTIVKNDTPIVAINTAQLGIALNWKNELGFTDLPDLFLDKNKGIIINTLINYNKPFLIEKSYFEYFGGIAGVFYMPDCDKFKKISEKYNIQELTEMNKLFSIPIESSLLYLTPKTH